MPDMGLESFLCIQNSMVRRAVTPLQLHGLLCIQTLKEGVSSYGFVPVHRLLPIAIA